MNSLFLNGLKVTFFLGLVSLGLVFVGWFLFKEYVLAIAMTYLLVHLNMWMIILILTLRENKNDKNKKCNKV